MKCHVLRISKYFLSDHVRSGELTYFKQKILNGEKIHTLRLNYKFWKPKINEINAGKAYLSLREWKETPFRSKQVEFLTLYKVGIEEIKLNYKSGLDLIHINHSFYPDFLIYINHSFYPDLMKIIHNDGLNEPDFINWFKKKERNNKIIPVEINFEGIIIHFTDFRYIK